MIPAGVIMAAVGSYLVWIMGGNYGTCHQWYVNGAQAACQTADQAHGWGLLLLILGLALAALGLMVRGHDRG